MPNQNPSGMEQELRWDKTCCTKYKAGTTNFRACFRQTPGGVGAKLAVPTLVELHHSTSCSLFPKQSRSQHFTAFFTALFMLEQWQTFAGGFFYCRASRKLGTPSSSCRLEHRRAWRGLWYISPTLLRTAKTHPQRVLLDLHEMLAQFFYESQRLQIMSRQSRFDDTNILQAKFQVPKLKTSRLEPPNPKPR